MDISIFLIKLGILSIPGVITLLLINTLSIYKTREPFFFSLFGLLLGVVNYIAFSILYLLALRWGCLPTFFDRKLDIWITLFQKESTVLPYLEVASASLIGVGSGLLLARWLSNSTIFRLANRLRITDKSGDDDIWFYFTNAHETVWVYVRDFQQRLTYFGAVAAYSEPNQDREIVLTSVSVYHSKKGTLLYEVPAIDLTLTKGAFSIEHAKGD